MLKSLITTALLFIVIASSISAARTPPPHSANVFRFDPIVLVEEPAIGTLVLDLAAQLDITDLASSDYKFRFYSPHSLTSHYFLIDQLTGHVKTQRMLDREYLCENKVCGPCIANSNCSLPVEIVATQGTSRQQKFVSFDVIIEDKNEFAPKFPREVVYLNLSEAAPANFMIPIEAAVDRDSKQTHITYSIEPVVATNRIDSYESGGGNNNDDTTQSEEYETELKRLNSKISLVSGGGSNGQPQLSLLIREPFDYEEVREVKFKILATDGGSSSFNSTGNKHHKPLVGSCLVVLRIIDINDNLPVFDNTQYEYRLDENKAIAGTRLIRVHATDKDDGNNGLVKYSLVDQTLTQSQHQNQQSSLSSSSSSSSNTGQIQVKSLFKIDETSGWISLAESLDYEQTPVYRLVVQAQDSGLANSMPVYTNVIIYLNDVNDNAPVLNITAPNAIDDYNNNLTISSRNLIELSEWTMPDTFLAQLIVTDADADLNGQVKLEMSQFKRKTLTRTPNNDVDEDENIEDDYDDADINWSESSDFSLVHLFNNIYSLMTKERLDREKFDFYLINITATDHGQPIPLRTTVNLYIRIKDENDNKPEFVASDELVDSARIDPITGLVYYEFNVTELVASEEQDLDQWVRIGQVKAVDYDSGVNGEVTFSLVASSEQENNDFRVSPRQGVVEARRRVLDRELKSRYEFTLLATDGLNNATTRLIINLLDLNDNRPRFDASTYNFQVYENMLNNEKPIAKLTASDADSGSNSLIQYKLINSQQSYVDVNAKTGELVQLKEFDYETIKRIEFDVIAYDNWNRTPSLNATCHVQIDVVDLNDNKPILVQPRQKEMPLIYSIESLLQNATVEKNVKAASNRLTFELGRLVAADLDSGLNGRVKFRLERVVKLQQQSQQPDFAENNNELKMFEVEPASGKLSTSFTFKRSKYAKEESKRNADYFANVEVDGRVEGIYGLVVSLTDSGVDSLTTRAYIFLALVNNANETSASLTAQLALLRTILNETKLNKNELTADLDDFDDDEMEDYDEEYDENNKPMDPRFTRVLEQFRNFKPKKLNKDLKLLRKNEQRASRFDFDGLMKLTNEMLASLSKGSNNKLMLLVGACTLVLLTIVFVSLCIFSAYFKNRAAAETKNDQQKFYPNGFIHIDDGANKGASLASSSNNTSNSSTLLTKTNRTHSTIIKHELTTTASSASPSSSLTTSEILADGSDSAATPHKTMGKTTTLGRHQHTTVTNSVGVMDEDEIDFVQQQQCLYATRTLMSRKAMPNGAKFVQLNENNQNNYLVKINNKCHTLGRQTNLRHGDLNSSSTSGEEEKTALISSSNSPPALNANMASPTSSAASSSQTATSATLSTGYQKSVNSCQLSGKKVNIINNQLSVLVTNSETAKKCIVASSESLTSDQTDSLDQSGKLLKQSSNNDSSAAATMTTSSPHESITSKTSSSDNSSNVNNFKTFKNNSSAAQILNSPQQQKHIYHQQHQNLTDSVVVNPYKTLPNGGGGGYRQNYIDNYSQLNESNNIVTRPAPVQKQQRKLSILDQKQLNLPVNELFKRYELKRQAAAGSLSSSGSLTDLTTVAGGGQQQQTTVKQSAVFNGNNVTNANQQHISTFIASPRLNRINLLSASSTTTTTTGANPIPDYFFKDEKEHKKFLASNGGKQMLNLTHVDIN